MTDASSAPCTCELCTAAGRQLTAKQHAECRENPAFLDLWKRHSESPSFLRRAANASRAAGRVANAVIRRDPVLASADLVAERRRICGECDQRIVSHDKEWCQHRSCGCLIRLKTTLLTESCPLGKWPSIQQ